ncbi:MAG: IPTL-CTERM sorting domain-containing protein [Burkholderiales bacterium]|nr:IPTL-CTERM sorting domain-containing protein [Burkholderiales bacterium]
MRDLTRQLVRASIVLLCACCLTLPIVARAASAGSGSAAGLFVDLELLPLLGSPVTAALGPVPVVTGTAPADFSLSQTELSASVAAGAAATISTGALQAQTQSTLASNTVASQASVDGLSLSLSGLLGLTADTVASSANASCTGATPSFSGSTTIANAGVSGLLLGAVIDSVPAANTQLLPLVLNPLGISITLNAQTQVGNTFTVDAIRVNLSDTLLSLIGLLSGEIYVARSVVSLADCTTPASTDLAIAKSGPATVNVGTPFDYDITLSNVSADATSGTITVTDVVPASLAIDSITAGANFNCNLSGNTVSCTRTTPIPGNTSDVLAMTIRVAATTTGQVSNTASVSGGGDTNPGNDTSPPRITQVEALPVDVVGNPDSGSVDSGTAGLAVASVVANDTINGAPAVLGSGGNASISPWGAWPSAYQLDVNSGEVGYDGTPQAPGVITLQYQLCDQAPTPNCGAPVSIQIIVAGGAGTHTIPTLSQWGLMLLSLILALGSWMAMRRRGV